MKRENGAVVSFDAGFLAFSYANQQHVLLLYDSLRLVDVVEDPLRVEEFDTAVRHKKQRIGLLWRHKKQRLW